MKIILALSLLFTGLAHADSGYLTPFIGQFSVVSRACDLADPICTEATNLELLQNPDGSFTLRELNEGAVLFERILSEGSSSYITGEEEPPMESGTWTGVHTNSSGQCDHSEMAAFQQDTSDVQPLIDFMYEVDDTAFAADGSAQRKTSRREYILKK
jgi:hypothetical protein